jgi:PPOX class probable FMN-dependent enzyme
MIDSKEALRALYPSAKGRAVTKEISHLDRHCLRFIALSPFVVLASSDGQGNHDASPRGGEPGFVHADADRIWIPDAPGNNRLDTLENIAATGSLGLLFLIPGVDETLRVNGRARLRDDVDLLGQFRNEKRTPRIVIELSVDSAYLHCAKALMRSKLWDPAMSVERSVLPTMGQMINDQTGTSAPVESQEEMKARYQADL